MKYRIVSNRAAGFRVLVDLVLFLAAAWPAHAALRTWTGAGANAFWSTPSNWSPSGAPQNGEDLLFPANAPRR